MSIFRYIFLSSRTFYLEHVFAFFICDGCLSRCIALNLETSINPFLELKIQKVCA